MLGILQSFPFGMHNLFSGAKSCCFCCYVSFRELYWVGGERADPKVIPNRPWRVESFGFLFGFTFGWTNRPFFQRRWWPPASLLLWWPQGAKLYMLIYDETYLYCHRVYINISNSECTAVQCVFFIVHYIMIFDIYWIITPYMTPKIELDLLLHQQPQRLHTVTQRRVSWRLDVDLG